ncbi:MAG TPA: hypothetical protein VJS88_04280 [Chthoniobacterales bacterium]|nr:hypothetical protein [Chthoniobacterales bacterium]
MFPLKTSTFPTTAAELASRLNESLRDAFHLPGDPVVVREIAYPRLAAITVSLDGAQLKGAPPAMPSVSGEAAPALSVDSFAARGSGLAVGPAAIDFALEATGVDLRRANDRDGNIVLLLHKAAQGRIDLSTATADLEALIAEVAAAEAGKHGVAIDKVQLSLRSNGPRSLGAEVRLRGRKLFMSASLRITGQLDLDDQLNARVSGLDCTGEGAIASVACGILKPQLQRVEGRVFPLMSLPIGEVRLRDVRIAAGEKLSVTAEFGSAHV